MHLMNIFDRLSRCYVPRKVRAQRVEGPKPSVPRCGKPLQGGPVEGIASEAYPSRQSRLERANR